MNNNTDLKHGAALQRAGTGAENMSDVRAVLRTAQRRVRCCQGCALCHGAEAMSGADRLLKWLEDAGKHWDTVRPEDVMRELGRADERDERISELEAEVTRLKKQLEYGDVTPASAVAAEVAVLRENNEALGLRVNELEAEATAMREGLWCDCGNRATCIGRYEVMEHSAPACDTCCGHGCEDGRCEPLADAGKAVLERLAKAERIANSARPSDEWDSLTRRAIGFQPMGHPDDCRCDDLCEQVTDISAAIRAKAKEGT